MLVASIRNLTRAHHRTPRHDQQLGILLAGVAGAINAGGFLAVGYYTSHMTGIVSSIGDFIALNQVNAALLALLYLLAFGTGAATSALIINCARAQNLHSEYALVLMVEAILLLVFGLFAADLSTHIILTVNLTIFLLCFIMGMQNALITKISGAVVRTTHVTGLVTDIGIALGRGLYGFCSGDKTIHIKRDALWLHTSLLLAFLGGGIVGALLFKHAGFVATLPFALLLSVLAIIPIVDDLRGKR